MHLRTLADLPPPPSGKGGWPWTLEGSNPPLRTTNTHWPKITIVTPSYNQGQFIEETIRSVLLQNYPNLEYLILDGGSSDNTIDILRKYENAIDYWTSAPDRGQADAINRGFSRSNGQILAWLNSDDIYERGALAEAAELFGQHQEIDVISGQCRHWYGDQRDRLIDPSPLRTLEDFLKIKTNWMNYRLIVQPESFFRRRAFEQANGHRDELNYCFDVCLWMTMAKLGCRFTSVNRHWANFRIHENQKTQDLTNAILEHVHIAQDFLIENWTTFNDPIAIANELFYALQVRLRTLDAQLKAQQEMSKRLLQSTSYRLGRAVTKMKFW